MLSVLSLGTWSKSLPRAASFASRVRLPRYISFPFTPTNGSYPIRHLQHPAKRAPHTSRPTLDYAFAFDIDGVLMLGSNAIQAGANALKVLEEKKIPYILLTNGGGKWEADRVAELSQRLGVNVFPFSI
jgi:hypothetical protein